MTGAIITIIEHWLGLSETSSNLTTRLYYLRETIKMCLHYHHLTPPDIIEDLEVKAHLVLEGIDRYVHSGIISAAISDHTKMVILQFLIRLY